MIRVLSSFPSRSCPFHFLVRDWLSSFALVTGILSLDGAIWHVSSVDGIVFLCLAAVMYMWATSYLTIIQAALRFNSLQKPPEAEKAGAKIETGDVESISGESRGDDEGTK